MDVSRSIRKLRERHDMTQEEFGVIAGVSSMAVSQWENGRAVPRMGAIQRLSDHFGVPKSEIIGDDPGVSAESTAAVCRTTDERELIYLFRHMDSHGREHVMQTARMCAALTEKDGVGDSEDVALSGAVMR